MTQIWRSGALVFAGLLSAGISWGATPNDCHTLQHHGRLPEARACYESLTQAKDPYLRAEGFWGLEMYQDANNEFRAAVDQSKNNNAMYRVRWGRLLHERFNDTDADKLFQEALGIDSKNAEAYLGLAMVSADGFDDKAISEVTQALQLDPKLVEAHELLADLALENSDTAKAVEESDAAIQISPEALDAMAIHAAVEILADRPPDSWLDKISKVNPVYGEGYAAIGKYMILNYRYNDGIGYYRKAVALNPHLWSARSQLGINLMRMGQEQEARDQLEQCYDNGYRDPPTVNSLRLLDTLKNFVTFKTDTTILKFDKKEGDLLDPYFQQVLDESIATYEKKYKMMLTGPVQVEVYPNQDDFAVRTLGMPGIDALGVTFGNVIAMDSPSASAPGTYHWASTMRHELSHVFVIAATNYRVPRWFTEGLAVHEETQASPEWGDPVTPDILLAIRDRKLLPVSRLERSFTQPEYPTQVVVSYFQAGRICDYIQNRWGADKLVDMIHSFAQHKTTEETIQQVLGLTPEQFDTQFFAWLYGSLGPVAAHFDEWRDDLKKVAAAAKAQQYDQVIELGQKARDLYPDYVYDANAYEFLAQAYLAKNDKPAATVVLTEYEKKGGRNPDTLEHLASLEEEQKEIREAALTLDRINYIYPIHDEKLHRHLGDLWVMLNNYPAAIREYTAVLALNPLDRASAEYDLAQAYFDAGQHEQASEHVLASLEIAPGYRPAQQLLLELNPAEKGN